MKKCIRPIVLFLLLLLMAACGGEEESPPPTNTPVPAPTQTSTPVPTDTALPAPTDTPVPVPTETPVPTDTPAPTATPEPVAAESSAGEAKFVDFTVEEDIPDAAVFAVDLLGAWVDAGAPETDAFSYTGKDGKTYEAVFDEDVLPLFTEANVWYVGAPSCVSCHHANLENAYHEMDLSSYAGILAGGDRLSEPPGVPLLGQSEVGATDFDWGASKLRGRLRNNRMPPGMPFDITEANRDGPARDVHGTQMNAVDLVMAWVEAGLPETDAFGDFKATFDEDILPLFTEPGMWYADAPSCTSCHHANLENSYHELDLSSYAGITLGADRLSEPPGVPLFGQSEAGATDFDWDHSKMKERLRNNRMPPGMPFDITEANRDGPLVQVGFMEGQERGASITGADIDLSTPPDVAVVDALVNRGGCKACHLIPQLDGAVGTLGRPWCEAAKEFQEGQIDLAFLYTSIVEPNAVVEEGYLPNLMPGTFGEIFNEDEIGTLIAFIATLDCEDGD